MYRQGAGDPHTEPGIVDERGGDEVSTLNGRLYLEQPIARACAGVLDCRVHENLIHTEREEVPPCLTLLPPNRASR
jgi:hypothetical protein